MRCVWCVYIRILRGSRTWRFTDKSTIWVPWAYERPSIVTILVISPTSIHLGSHNCHFLCFPLFLPIFSLTKCITVASPWPLPGPSPRYPSLPRQSSIWSFILRHIYLRNKVMSDVSISKSYIAKAHFVSSHFPKPTHSRCHHLSSHSQPSCPPSYKNHSLF